MKHLATIFLFFILLHVNSKLSAQWATSGGNTTLTGNAVIPNGSFLISGSTALTPTLTGRAFTWIPSKAAFRAGEPNGDTWTAASIGLHSYAMGYGVKASGAYTFAVGQSANAIGQHSMAIGNGCISTGSVSTAIGINANSIGSSSIAIGDGAKTVGLYSMAFGSFVTANSNKSTAFGYYNVDNGSATTNLLTDPLLTIGNGTSAALPSNALTILKNGNIGIGSIISPTANLHLSGTMKLEGTTTLEFGADVASKEPSAGKIGYGIFTPGVLDIVGAGTNTSNRQIKFWSEGGVSFNGIVNIGNGIASASPYSSTCKLSVRGTIVSTQSVVTQLNWADYVFDKNYKLKSLEEVGKYIKANHHLPEVPSTEEIKEAGNNLGETDAVLLKKIEELTLYLLDQQKQIDALKAEVQKNKK